MNVTFTTDEFLQQVGEFRKLMGAKSFMEGPEEKRDVAVKALGYAYLITEGTKEEMETCAAILNSTLEEYGRRQAYIVMRPLRQTLDGIDPVTRFRLGAAFREATK